MQGLVGFRERIVGRQVKMLVKLTNLSSEF